MRRTVEMHLEVGVAAALLGMTRRFVRDRVKAGDFEGFMLGNKMVVTAASVNRYLEAARVVTKEEAGATPAVVN